MKAKLRTDDLDEHLGATLKLLRVQRKISQSELGEELGITFQQIQKYESGKNRISAAQLYRISEILQVSPMVFFDGLMQPSKTLQSTLPLLNDHDFEKVLKSWSNIEHKNIRKKLAEVAEAIAKS